MAAVAVSQLSPELQDIINANKSLHLLENGKIRCKLSGHEIPCRLDAIEQYVSGKKYQKLAKEADIDLSLYKEHLTPSFKPGQEHLLFCKLTCRHINNTADGIQNHVKGKKFQRAFARFKECEENGIEFKPNVGRRSKIERSAAMSNNRDDDDDDKESVDSLSDLYPAEDFKDLSLNDNDDDDDDDDEMDGSKSHVKNHEKNRGVKRKSTDKRPKVLKGIIKSKLSRTS